MQKIISLCKRRGFIFQSSEIYGGLAAVYDLGPYGVELANNIKMAWWRAMVQENINIVGLDSAIFMRPEVWQASGHTRHFSDPLVECRKCHSRWRVDHLLGEIGVQADEKIPLPELQSIFEKHKKELKCFECGASDFALPQKFNLLVKSNLGNFTEQYLERPVYLRGETCQGIYVNFKNILNSTHQQIPFGVAQIGKAFRNEITARQFIFRTREFEQMEMQFFVAPDQEMIWYEKWRERRMNWYYQLGIKKENLRWMKHKNLVFYAKAAWDIEYRFPWGFDEIEGVHARGDYDLKQHSRYSHQDLTYTDPQSKQKYIPHVVETSAGVGRIMLALLCDAYKEQEQRVVLKLKPSLAPYKVAVFPLLVNRPKLVKKAKEVFELLKPHFMVAWDKRGNIGKRYYSQDELGTPFCVTIDFKTLEDDTVTVRDRDTTKQERVKIQNLKRELEERLKED